MVHLAPSNRLEKLVYRLNDFDLGMAAQFPFVLVLFFDSSNTLAVIFGIIDPNEDPWAAGIDDDRWNKLRFKKGVHVTGSGIVQDILPENFTIDLRKNTTLGILNFPEYVGNDQILNVLIGEKFSIPFEYISITN